MTHASSTTLAVLLLAVGAFGCGSSSGVDAAEEPDAEGGQKSDASQPTDRGDAGTSAPDGGPSNDAGPPRDDATADGGHPDDATRAPDQIVPDGGGGPTGLHVVMGSSGSVGHIVDGSGKIVQLHGADRSGTEFSCLYGGFFDGPADQGDINAMKAWNINAVRVPLNADCWLGINGVASAYSGSNYQNAIKTWVNLITSNGMVAILDLHWTAPGTTLANSQIPMADADHSPLFWTQVATAFKSNGAVIFDLFNEPFITDWTCWISGGMCAQSGGNNYNVAGMAALLQAVRKAGANNVVILGGLSYSSDMSQWVKSVQSIATLASPLNGISIDNVAVSWHAYDFNSEQSGCPSQYNNYSTTCNSAQVTAMNTSVTDVLAAGFPLIIGESGITADSTKDAMPFSATQITGLQTWFDGLLTWTEGQGQSYLAWSWNTDTGPVLLSSYDGGPSPYFGQTYQKHLAKF